MQITVDGVSHNDVFGRPVDGAKVGGKVVFHLALKGAQVIKHTVSRHLEYGIGVHSVGDARHRQRDHAA